MAAWPVCVENSWSRVQRGQAAVGKQHAFDSFDSPLCESFEERRGEERRGEEKRTAYRIGEEGRR